MSLGDCNYLCSCFNDGCVPLGERNYLFSCFKDGCVSLGDRNYLCSCFKDGCVPLGDRNYLCFLVLRTELHVTWRSSVTIFVLVLRTAAYHLEIMNIFVFCFKNDCASLGDCNYLLFLFVGRICVTGRL